MPVDLTLDSGFPCSAGSESSNEVDLEAKLLGQVRARRPPSGTECAAKSDHTDDPQKDDGSSNRPRRPRRCELNDHDGSDRKDGDECALLLTLETDGTSPGSFFPNHVR